MSPPGSSGGRNDERTESAEPVPPEGLSAQSEGTIDGERTIPSINRARSSQSRVSSALAIGLMSAIGIGLLAWYYSGAMTRQTRAEDAARAAAQARAKGEMPL